MTLVEGERIELPANGVQKFEFIVMTNLVLTLLLLVPPPDPHHQVWATLFSKTLSRCHKTLPNPRPQWKSLIWPGLAEIMTDKCLNRYHIVNYGHGQGGGQYQGQSRKENILVGQAWLWQKCEKYPKLYYVIPLFHST